MSLSSYIRWNYEEWPDNYSSILRVGVEFGIPWAYKCAIGPKKCPNNMPGVNIEFFHALMLRMGISYKLVACPPEVFNEFQILGCAGQILDGSIDVVIGPSGDSEFRDKYVDFTRPVVYFRFGALLGKKLALPVAQNMTEGISGALLIGLFCVVIIDFLFVLPKLEDVSSVIMKIIVNIWFGVAICQSTTSLLYSNLMTSRALEPRVVYPFKSFDELINQVVGGDRKLLGFQGNMNPGIAYWEYFSPVLNTNQHPYYEELKSYLAKPGMVQSATKYEEIQYLSEDPQLTSVASAFTMQYMAAKNPTMLAITENRDRHLKWYSYMVQNGSSLRTMLSDVILFEIQNMKYSKLIDKYTERDRVVQLEMAQPLTVSSLYVPAFVYLFGSCTGLVCLVVEAVWTRILANTVMSLRGLVYLTSLSCH